MAGVHEFSEKVIDYAERLSDMADAAQGRHRHGGGAVRWMLLPASGAALLALVRSDFFARQAKEVLNEAKTRASDLPDELMDTVRQAAGTEAGTARREPRSRASQRGSSARGSTRSSSARRTGARKSASTRRTSASR